MPPSRRVSNGRSPLVNKQSQITAFFSPGKTSPSPSSTTPVLPKQNQNPKPSPSPTSHASPSLTKEKQSVLVIGPSSDRSSPNPVSSSVETPESAKEFYGQDAVGKRIRVYWPLDKTWYEGVVKSFDNLIGKHLVQYDDAEEEFLKLEDEKIELVEQDVRSFRRLKKRYLASEEEFLDDEEKKEGRFRRLKRNSISEETEVQVEEEKEDSVEAGSGGDDSADEDWGKNMEKENVDDGDDDIEEMTLDEEEENEGVENEKQGRGSTMELKKRKKSDDEKISSGKKSKRGGSGDEVALKVSQDGNGSRLFELATNAQSK